MNIEQNVALKGRFKFDVYNKDGVLKSSSEQDNFITSSGLNYPTGFPFASCFRYVSLGCDDTANDLTTDSLSDPWNAQSYQYIGGPGEYLTGSFGFREYDNVLSLFRGWRVPVAGGFDQDYAFKEFIVSPGCPQTRIENSKYEYYLNIYKTQINYNNTYPNPPSYYGADKAFARVLKNIDVSNGDYLHIFYTLNCVFDTGVKYKEITIGQVTPPDTVWGNQKLSGRGNLVHHGLSVICSDYNSPKSPKQLWPTEGGEACSPVWGNPLEPSVWAHSSFYETNLGGTGPSELFGQVSADNIQFLVNPFSGGKMPLDLYYPHNSDGIKELPSGTMAWRKTPSDISDGDVPTTLRKIRSSLADSNTYPQPTNASLEYSLSALKTNAGFACGSCFTNTVVTHTSLIPTVSTSRSRTGEYTFAFTPYNTEPYTFLNIPVRALSLFFGNKGSSSNIYPFFDMVIGQKNGNFHSFLNTPNHPTYSLPNNSVKDGNFYFPDTDNYELRFTFQFSWSAANP